MSVIAAARTRRRPPERTGFSAGDVMTAES
jgi:hypothetical protein